MGGDLLEVLLGGGALEDLAGFEEGDGAGAEVDGNRGGAESGEAATADRALHLGFLDEGVVRLDAGFTGGLAGVEFLAEGALVLEVFGEAPLVFDTDQAQGKTGGTSEGVLVGLVHIRFREAAKESLLVIQEGGTVCHAHLRGKNLAGCLPCSSPSSTFSRERARTA